MKKIKKATLLLSVALIVSMVIGVTALAHGTAHQGLEGNRVQFTFIGDEPYPYYPGHIRVLDANGNVIAEGMTNSEGIFDFSAYSNAHSIEVTDEGGGHRNVFYVSAGVTAAPAHGHGHGHGHQHNPQTGQEASHFITIVISVTALAGVALAALVISKKKLRD